VITTLIVLSSLAQAEPTQAEPAQAEPAAVKPSESQQALYAALKSREDAPTCESLQTHSTDLVNDLVWLVDNATQPPWVGIRAAQCIVRHHHVEKAELIESWMTTPERRGLAILTMGMLKELPPELGLTLQSAALAGPFSDDAKKHIERP